MKLLVIGSGGREHSIVWKLSLDKSVKKIFAIPGNGGISEIAECVNISPDDFEGIKKFVVEQAIDLTIVGPEEPLVKGIVDSFTKDKLRIFGPDRSSAKLEGSKIYAKEFMRKYNIPTADFETFDDYWEALKFIDGKSSGVIKADGLAAGKGSFVCDSYDEMKEKLHLLMVERKLGISGEKVVIEERLEGEESTILGFCDGKKIVSLPSSQDHKRLRDGDRGPNTGGMGAYSPVPFIDAGLWKRIDEEIFKGFLRGIKEEGLNFKGIIYFGLIFTDEGPKVLEFNCRLGDPEAQVILPLLKNDLVECLEYTMDEKLDQLKLDIKDSYSVCVVIASGGYPGKYEKGKVIYGLEDIEGCIVFHAGTKRSNGEFLTAGGRVLNVVGIGGDISEAILKAYDGVDKIKFEGMQFRSDIGKKALRWLATKKQG